MNRFEKERDKRKEEEEELEKDFGDMEIEIGRFNGSKEERNARKEFIENKYQELKNIAYDVKTEEDIVELMDYFNEMIDLVKPDHYLPDEKYHQYIIPSESE